MDRTDQQRDPDITYPAEMSQEDVNRLLLDHGQGTDNSLLDTMPARLDNATFPLDFNAATNLM